MAGMMDAAPRRKSSTGVQSPRLFLEMSPSAGMLKGFLHIGHRVASSRRQSEQRENTEISNVPFSAPDRYRNSVIHDARPPVEGVQGSSLIQHFGHVARRKDVWYVANGWLHCYRYVAEHARVERQR
jgi:hypothetical protein